jgi:AcrR family transcriptional regulator
MLQKQKSEHTKQLILNESFKLFHKNGFKTTSIDKVMEATKLTKGAFYHHYKNKKELGIAVINLKLKERIFDAMITPLSLPGDAIDILTNTFINRIKSFPVYDKKHGCPLNNLINEVADYETAYQLALKKLIEEWKLALITLIERGQKENTIRKDINSKAVATYLISAFEGIRGIRKLYDEDSIIDEYIAGLSLYINQIKK